MRNVFRTRLPASFVRHIYCMTSQLADNVKSYRRQLDGLKLIDGLNARLRSGFTNAGELYSQLTNRLYATVVG